MRRNAIYVAIVLVPVVAVGRAINLGPEAYIPTLNGLGLYGLGLLLGFVMSISEVRSRLLAAGK